METTSLNNTLPLPHAFVDFLNQNGLDPSTYVQITTQSTPRYIRLKSGDGETHVAEIEADINSKLEKVEWLPGFYSIPPHIQIASTKSYKEGKIYGMDAASGAAVLGLNVSPGDHVLDLCAAPGAKLCMLLDFLGSSGSLTGVDIARHRLAACRTMLQKYGLGDRCRLFVANGASFSLLPVQKCADALIIEETKETFKEWTPKRSWKERKASKARNGTTSQLASGTQEPELIFYGRHSGVVGLTKSELFRISCSSNSFDSGYDKEASMECEQYNWIVINSVWKDHNNGKRESHAWSLSKLCMMKSQEMDPSLSLSGVPILASSFECTHDGSIKHIQKFENWGWKTLERRVLDAHRTDILTNLQLQLLTNGFRLLRIGGMLVYSTCSLTVAQNEDVVEQFLSQNPFAELQEINAAKNWPCRCGRIPKTLRFDPLTSQTSGLFLAKFTKYAA